MEATLSVKPAGSPPLHIVCEATTVPPDIELIVTTISLLVAVQDIPLKVLVVIRL